MSDGAPMDRLQWLCDLEEIRSQLVKYCRAIDRLDRELLLDVYHPDAVDDHAIFIGTAADFVDWVLAYQAEWFSATQHIITNNSCDVEGDTAHSETYWLAASMDTAGNPLPLASGRYVDRFERRGGKWRIAARKMLPEWGEMKSWLNPEVAEALASEGGSRRDRADASYLRPLNVRNTAVVFDRPAGGG